MVTTGRTDDISVVIPVRNRAGLVGRTLESLRPQAALASRIVLVDNASTDSTADVLRRWADTVPNACVLTETRPGAAAARNRGLECLAPGGYVLFFDSDDIMPRRHLEQVSRELRAAGAPAVGAFDAVIVNPDGRRYPRPFRRRGSLLTNQLFHGVLSTQRMVLDTDFLRLAGGWNAGLRVWDDLELGLRLLACGARVKRLRLDEPVTICHHGDSITGNDFSSKAGQWELALDACEQAMPPRLAPMTDYRRAILAGYYMREGRRDLADAIRFGHRSAWMKLISRYVAAGGRGVAEIARITELCP